MFNTILWIALLATISLGVFLIVRAAYKERAEIKKADGGGNPHTLTTASGTPYTVHARRPLSPDFVDRMFTGVLLLPGPLCYILGSVLITDGPWRAFMGGPWLWVWAAALVVVSLVVSWVDVSRAQSRWWEYLKVKAAAAAAAAAQAATNDGERPGDAPERRDAI